jgi:hypothetical protein
LKSFDAGTAPNTTISPFNITLTFLSHSFTGVGYPKAVPVALAKHVEENNLEGQLRFSLFAGASLGPEVEERTSHPFSPFLPLFCNSVAISPSLSSSFSSFSLLFPLVPVLTSFSSCRMGQEQDDFEEVPSSGRKGDREGYQQRFVVSPFFSHVLPSFSLC